MDKQEIKDYLRMIEGQRKPVFAMLADAFELGRAHEMEGGTHTTCGDDRHSFEADDTITEDQTPWDAASPSQAEPVALWLINLYLEDLDAWQVLTCRVLFPGASVRDLGELSGMGRNRSERAILRLEKRCPSLRNLMQRDIRRSDCQKRRRESEKAGACG